MPVPLDLGVGRAPDAGTGQLLAFSLGDGDVRAGSDGGLLRRRQDGQGVLLDVQVGPRTARLHLALEPAVVPVVAGVGN